MITKERKQRRADLEAKRKLEVKPFRKFLGKLEGFVDNRERNFEKKHLEAYLKDHIYFTYGKNIGTGESKYFPVKFEKLTK